MISLIGRVSEQVIEQTISEPQIAAKPLDASGEAASIIYESLMVQFVFGVDLSLSCYAPCLEACCALHT